MKTIALIALTAVAILPQTVTANDFGVQGRVEVVRVQQFGVNPCPAPAVQFREIVPVQRIQRVRVEEFDVAPQCGGSTARFFGLGGRVGAGVGNTTIIEERALFGLRRRETIVNNGVGANVIVERDRFGRRINRARVGVFAGF